MESGVQLGTFLNRAWDTRDKLILKKNSLTSWVSHAVGMKDLCNHTSDFCLSALPHLLPFQINNWRKGKGGRMRNEVRRLKMRFSQAITFWKWARLNWKAWKTSSVALFITDNTFSKSWSNSWFFSFCLI